MNRDEVVGRPGSSLAWSELQHARAIYLLDAASVSCIVLKGLSTVRWLYPDRDRALGDVDLLVAPVDLTRAIHAFVQMGWRLTGEGTTESELPRHAATLSGNNVQFEVDLHTTFHGVAVPPEQAFALLSSHTEPFSAASGSATQLDVTGRALIIALHAAISGPARPKSVEDLRRAIDHATTQEWADALTLARELGAERPFASGLSQLPAGQAVLDQLGITAEAGLEWALRAQGARGPAIFLARFAAATRREKARLLLREVFPTAAFLRYGWPIARIRGIGLILAWFQRTGQILRKLPKAAGQVRSARRR